MPSTKYTSHKTIRLTYLHLAFLEQPLIKGKGGDILRFLLDQLMEGKLPPEMMEELENKLGLSNIIQPGRTAGTELRKIG